QGQAPLLEGIGEAVDACPADGLLTGSFDERNANLKPAQKRALCQRRIKSVLRLLGGQAKPNLKKITRKTLAVQYGQLGQLLGKNAFSMFANFLRTSRKQVAKWCKAPGCLLGPGVVAGLNLVEGRWCGLRVRARGPGKAIEAEIRCVRCLDHSLAKDALMDAGSSDFGAMLAPLQLLHPEP
ncbi:unnamed protein product, partial [Symbiodinium microadriaticum]